MAFHSRSGAFRAIPGGREAATIDDLPDGVLLQVLALLSNTRERQQVALVCKRFATLASTPQLLREVDLGSISPSLEVLHSLTAWLGQHGRHMRTVSIALSDGNYEPTAVASCLAAAGTAGQQLQQLSVDGCNWGTEWLATMRSLRSCKLEASYNRALHISASVSMLTALENLSLSGCPITFAEGSSLPPSITRLDLADGGHDVPLQVLQLPGLQQLGLESCSYTADSTAQLWLLGSSLTRLEVFGFDNPDPLPALTQLRHLSLQDCDPPEQHGGWLDTALEQLQQLTCLVFISPDMEPPAALGGLRQLQRCFLYDLDVPRAGNAAPLPGGPWLRSLRWLGAGIDTLLASAAALQGATALQFVFVHDFECPPQFDWQAPAAFAFFDWLATWPSLERVCFESWLGCMANGPTAFGSPGFQPLLQQLAQQRPALQLHCHTAVFDPFNESLWSELRQQ